MARKVLISFLGTGPQGSANRAERQYREADYYIGSDHLGKYSFVSAALIKHYHVDTLFLIGSVHSMWEKVYEWFCEFHGKPIDENVWTEIFDYCDKANYQSPLEIPHKDVMEQVLGGESRIIPIKYGLNEEDVKDNINIILGLQAFLKCGDELIVDITHSFRSLPMFIMNLLIYLQNANPTVKISHIHYGMLDVSSEMDYKVPIVELKSLMDVSQWITGMYTFREFGNAYNIAELIEDENKNTSNMMKEFSDLMNLNHLYGIQKISQRLSSIKNKKYNTLLPQLTINPIVNDFIKQFPSDEKRHSVFQLNVARWQYEHKKYAQALLTITETIITYVCELNKFNWEHYDDREKVKELLRQNKIVDNGVGKIYFKLNRLRNNTAHAISTDNNVPTMLSKLKQGLEQLEKIIK